MSKTLKGVMVLICCVFILGASSFAQEVYPNKPVQIIVPFAAGGSLDLIARILSEKFRDSLDSLFLC